MATVKAIRELLKKCPKCNLDDEWIPGERGESICAEHVNSLLLAMCYERSARFKDALKKIASLEMPRDHSFESDGTAMQRCALEALAFEALKEK